MKRYWSFSADLLAPLATAAVLAFTPCSLRADDIEPFHAPTIQPYVAPTLTPHEAKPVEPVHADPVEPVHADPVKPYIADKLESIGNLLYAPPAGWERNELKGVVYYVCPKKNDGLVLLGFYPCEEAGGDFRGWYDAKLAKIRGSAKIAGESEVKTARTKDGLDMIFGSQVTEDKEGARVYRFFLGMHAGSQYQLVAYNARTEVGYKANQSALMNVLSSMKINRRSPEPSRPTPAPVRHTPRADGNLVEPFSNGISLAMSADRMISIGGKPRADERHIGAGITYPDFWVMFNAAGSEVWHFRLTGEGMRMNSGIGVGSTRAEVRSTFPGGISMYNGYSVTYDQYSLKFAISEDTDRVTEIQIEAAKRSYKPYHRVASDRQPSPERRPTPERKTEPTPKPSRSGDRSAVVGSYYGNYPIGQIDLLANGTYKCNANVGGNYAINGEDVTFTGSLKSWDNGHGTLKNGVLEFYWTNKDGWKNYFAYVKGK